MHPRSNTRTFAPLFLLIAQLLCTGLYSQQQSGQPPAGQSSAPAGVHREGTDNILVDQYGVPLEDQSGRGIPQAQSPTSNAAPSANVPNQPENTISIPTTRQPQAPATGKSGEYIFRAQVEEVTLHATVVDQRNRLVSGLNKNDFQVFEDGKPQQITFFGHEDVPVSLGIIIDNSGSMREKRAAVNQAAINLVKASNPNDEVFIVNFNDEAFIDQDFTSNINQMKEGLEHIDARGGTALYDAVVASADHLAKVGRLQKKVLLIVTDGEDNASRDTLEQTVHRVQDDNGPTVYSIGLLGGEKQKRARRALEALALQTGGVAFFPKDLGEVNDISLAIAHDIRSQYRLQYRPTRPQDEGGYRQVRVEAHAGGYKNLQVRTRSGYFAGQQKAEAASSSPSRPQD